MSKSISLLLGAGFSAPMGYPVGKDLNDKLLGLNGTEFKFGVNESGSYYMTKRMSGVNCREHARDEAFKYCVEQIHEYKQRKQFDYEEFYDWLVTEAWEDERHFSVHVPEVYISLVLYFLKDKNKDQYYRNSSLDSSQSSSYDGILDFILSSIESGNIVNVHTLNHDLLFEQFNKQGPLTGKISDGFERENSPYYSNPHHDIKSLRQLRRYTGNYNQACRLYKLHGSIDQFWYNKSPERGSQSNHCVKLDDFDDIRFVGEMVPDENGVSNYQGHPGQFHPDSLTGTTSKELRYQEPFYTELFDQFKKNRQQAEKLIIIGYGGKDEEVNKIIREHFDHKNKPSYIIDPYAGDAVRKLAREIGATILPPEKTVETVTAEDLYKR